MTGTEDVKMKVEVWSDIMCPFCYIGKRNYETALKAFGQRENVEIEWHSFQLDRSIPPSRTKKENVIQYVADKKGISYEQSAKLHDNLVQTAKKAGLDYHFDQAIVANSFDAHKMIQLAKIKGLGDAAEERLFRAYFTEGMDFGDHETLLQLGKDLGLSSEDIVAALDSPEFSERVEADIREAAELGIGGVPFFVFARKYAVSGAQPPEHFLQALEKSFAEWKSEHPDQGFDVESGAVCIPDGSCT